MKNYLFLFIILFSLKASAQQDPLSAFQEKWRNSKAYLLTIAESMPEGKYNFKPTKREMSFKEQLLHIRQNMLWLGDSYFSEKGSYEENADEQLNGKEEIIKALSASFDRVYEQIRMADPEKLKETVNFFAGPKTRLQILNLLQDHVTHHRGQLIVYLNLNEIRPPRYTGW
ncbi:DinB family protein [Leptobacterium flavescens]|uniref:DinB family protein n=1 Tax=Leptobacterium flavescens TaxID=472055 RepID=A0A6P0URX7_9FLAO|nr:DinB family protein [Leptobacterium flavescens]NER13136.1 DinB family protein [Leptobacterium flavescens]